MAERGRLLKIKPRTDFHIPTFLRATNADNRAFNRSTNSNFFSILLHSPGRLIEFDCIANLGHFDRVWSPNQMLGQFTEANRDGTVFFGLYPSMSAMVVTVL